MGLVVISSGLDTSLPQPLEASAKEEAGRMRACALHLSLPGIGFHPLGPEKELSVYR
jgi:hypothetical protein